MDFDVAVIGAGIAGAAAAYELACTHRVVLIERESHPGYHSTGRSAALYTETYGPRAIRLLARASRPFLSSPPDGFTDVNLLTPRGVLFIASDAQAEAADQFAATAAAFAGTAVPTVEIAASDALARIPILDAAYLSRAFFEAGAMDIDVHALHQGFLRGLRAGGGRLITDAEVLNLTRHPRGWRAETRAGTISAAAIVNAAGAWADDIGRLAGAKPIGLRPKRRTALIVECPPHLRPMAWPMVCCVAETFYFKPEGAGLLISPADETPSAPCDAQPDELDIATAVDRFERASTLSVGRIGRKWAGLRSFVADKSPVAGPDPDLPGFFWLAGQGGYGIKTSPALGRLIAAAVRCDPMPEDLVELGLGVDDLSPIRLPR